MKNLETSHIATIAGVVTGVAVSAGVFVTMYLPKKKLAKRMERVARIRKAMVAGGFDEQLDSLDRVEQDIVNGNTFATDATLDAFENILRIKR